MDDKWTSTAKPGCKIISWSPEDKDGSPRPNCPECGGRGELDNLMGIKIGYFHKLILKPVLKEESMFTVEVIADNSGQFCPNGLTFTTLVQAEAYAKDLYSRWTAVKTWRVMQRVIAGWGFVKVVAMEMSK